MDTSSPNLNERCLLEYVAGRYHPPGELLPKGVAFQQRPVSLSDISLLPSTLVAPPHLPHRICPTAFVSVTSLL